MNEDKPLFLFSQDVGQGRTMFYGVLGDNQYWAQKYITKVLKSGKICEPNNPDTSIVRVDVVTNGERETAFKLVGYDVRFEMLMGRGDPVPLKK